MMKLINHSNKSKKSGSERSTKVFDWQQILADNPGSLETLLGATLKRKVRDPKAEIESYHSYFELGKVTTMSQFLKSKLKDDTIDTISRKTGISKPSLKKIISGEFKHASYAEKIASGYEIPLSTFLEYQKYVITTAIDQFLEENHETALIWFTRLTK